MQNGSKNCVVEKRFHLDAGAAKDKIIKLGAMAESADATDLKSVAGDSVRVRPPLAPHKDRPFNMVCLVLREQAANLAFHHIRQVVNIGGINDAIFSDDRCDIFGRGNVEGRVIYRRIGRSNLDTINPGDFVCRAFLNHD